MKNKAMWILMVIVAIWIVIISYQSVMDSDTPSKLEQFDAHEYFLQKNFIHLLDR